jgi:hypothetical protein
MLSGSGIALCGIGRSSRTRKVPSTHLSFGGSGHPQGTTAIHVGSTEQPPLRQLTADLRSPILRNALLGNPCGEVSRRGGVSVRRMARYGGALYSSRRIGEMESLAFPPRSSFYDDGLSVQPSRAGSAVSYHLGSAVSVQKMRAAVADANTDRKICADAVVRSTEARVYLYLWARHIEGSGVAHYRNGTE